MNRKESGVLIWIRHRLTPEQRETLDAWSPEAKKNIALQAVSRPDGVNWVIEHFGLLEDQYKILEQEGL